MEGSDRTKRALTVATVGEAGLLAGVLAGYLVVVTGRLRNISKTLGQVTFGVRAIERQTEPIGPALRAIRDDLEGMAEDAASLSERRPSTAERRQARRDAGDQRGVPVISGPPRPGRCRWRTRRSG